MKAAAAANVNVSTCLVRVVRVVQSGRGVCVCLSVCVCACVLCVLCSLAVVCLRSVYVCMCVCVCGVAWWGLGWFWLEMCVVGC